MTALKSLTILPLALLPLLTVAAGQELTLETIMADLDWIGNPPIGRHVTPNRLVRDRVAITSPGT